MKKPYFVILATAFLCALGPAFIAMSSTINSANKKKLESIIEDAACNKEISLEISNHNRYDIMTYLPTQARKKVTKLICPYSIELPPNLPSLFPNLKSLYVSSFTLFPNNWKNCGYNYQIYMDNILINPANTCFNTHLSTHHILPQKNSELEALATSKFDTCFPKERNFSFSLEEVQALGGQMPNIKTNAPQDSNNYVIIDGKVCLNAPITKANNNAEASKPEDLSEDILPKTPLPNKKPDKNTLSHPIYLPLATFPANDFSSPFKLVSGNASLKRQEVQREHLNYKKLTSQLIEKSPMHKEAIKAFFAQIEAINKNPKNTSPVFIPLVGPPGTGKTSLFLELKENTPIPYEEHQVQISKNTPALPIKEVVKKMSEPADSQNKKVNLILFDEIQNIISEEELQHKLDDLEELKKKAHEQKKSFVKLTKEHETTADDSNATTNNDKASLITLEQKALQSTHDSIRDLSTSIKSIINKKQEAYELLQRVFGNGFYSTKTSHSTSEYLEFFLDLAGKLLTARNEQKAILEENSDITTKIGTFSEQITTLSKEKKALNADDDPKKIKKLTKNITSLENQISELKKRESSLKEKNQNCAEDISKTKKKAARLIEKLKDDYPRLLGDFFNDNPIKVLQSFLDTPVKFVESMQNEAQSASSQGHKCINRSIIFLAANNHALINRTNEKFKNGSSMPSRIDPQKYREAYQEQIQPGELQKIVLSRFTFYSALVRFNKIMNKEVTTYEEETSFNSRIKLNLFIEKLPFSPAQWNHIITQRLKEITSSIIKQAQETDIGIIRAIDDNKYIQRESDKGHHIPFNLKVDDSVVQFIYDHATGIDAFRTFNPKFDSIFQGFDKHILMALMDHQNKYEQDFVSAAANYFGSTNENSKSQALNAAHNIQRHILSLKNLTLALKEEQGSYFFVLQSTYNLENGYDFSKDITSFSVAIKEEEAKPKAFENPQDFLPSANIFSAILVLGIHNFLSRPNENIDFVGKHIESSLIQLLWPNRSVENYSYDYRKLMTLIGALAVSMKLNPNVKNKFESKYQEIFLKSLQELKQSLDSQERQFNVSQKDKLPLAEVVGEKLASLKFFQLLYENESISGDITEVLLNNAKDFIAHYSGIINEISNRLVEKAQKNLPLSFSDNEMYNIVFHFWPQTINRNKIKSSWFSCFSPSNSYIDEDEPPLKADISQGKLRSHILNSECGDAHITLCTNERHKNQEDSKSSKGWFSSLSNFFTSSSSKNDDTPLSDKELIQYGIVPPALSEDSHTL